MAGKVMAIHLNQEWLQPYDQPVEGSTLKIDYVNAEKSVIGDAKNYSKSTFYGVHGQELRSASKYAREMMKTSAQTRFLIFGDGKSSGGIEVARKWVKIRDRRFPQIDVYFLSDNRILTQILLDCTERVIGQF